VNLVTLSQRALPRSNSNDPVSDCQASDGEEGHQGHHTRS
jgi:hypothetical protein